MQPHVTQLGRRPGTRNPVRRTFFGLLAALTAAGTVAAVAPAAAGAAAVPSALKTFTWTGTADATVANSNWSDGANWKGGVAPTAPGPVDLDFPALKCTGTGPCGSTSYNDLTGLAVSHLTMQQAVGAVRPGPGAYMIGGNAITIGVVTVTALTPPPAEAGVGDQLLLPMSLPKSEHWTVAGNDGEVGFGAITGAGNLTVTSSGAGFVDFEGPVAVGTLDLVGANSAYTGNSSSQNGIVAVNGSLNANGHPVNLTDLGFFSTGGALGSFTTKGSALQLGNGGGGGPYGLYPVKGNLSLDAASMLTVFSLTPGTAKPPKPVAGTDYVQLSSTGSSALAGIPLTLYASCAQPLGVTYTLVKAAGGLSGTFGGLANGAIVQARADSNPPCATGTTPPWLKITYNDTAGTVTAKVVAPPPGASPSASAPSPGTMVRQVAAGTAFATRLAPPG